MSDEAAAISDIVEVARALTIKQGWRAVESVLVYAVARRYQGDVAGASRFVRKLMAMVEG